MAHFVDQFRYKFNKETQVLLFSVCITEHRVIEHSIPILLFWEMTECYRSNKTYTSDILKMKSSDGSVYLTIRENQLTRRSYNFNTSEFERLIGKFRRSVNFNDIDDTIDFSSSISPKVEHHYSEHSSQQITDNVKSLLTAQSNDTTQIVERLDSSEQLLLQLSKQLAEITVMIKTIQERGVVTTGQNPSNEVTEDMPMFIPNTVNTDFSGKITTNKQNAEDNSVASATQRLKQMKRKKGKKK